MTTEPPPSAPSWSDIEDRLVAELRTAVERLAEEYGSEPLAAIALWADPYKGWYEVVADSQARNAAGARERNARMLALLPELTGRPEAWKTAMTTAQRTQALDFDPQYGDWELAEEPIHEFQIKIDDFVRSDTYKDLNQGGEDGWLEGHMRFVIAGAIARLVQDGGFAAVASPPRLRVGYAYPDSGDAVIVAHVIPNANPDPE